MTTRTQVCAGWCLAALALAGCDSSTTPGGVGVLDLYAPPAGSGSTSPDADPAQSDADGSGDASNDASSGDPGSPDAPGGDASSGDAPDAGGAALSVSPASLEFGTTADSAVLDVLLTGGPTTYTLTADAAWVIPGNDGVYSYRIKRATVNIDRAGLQPGQHTAVLSVAAEGVGSRKVAINATVPVPGAGDAGGPILYVSKDQIDFGSAGTSVSFYVRNTGAGALGYALDSDRAWVTVTPSAGESDGEYDVIRAKADRTGLAAGDHNGTIRVTGGGQTLAIGVHVRVESGGGSGSDAQLYVDRSNLDFGLVQTRLSFLLRNTGSGSLDYSVVSEVPWAVPSPASGTNSGAYHTIEVDVARVGLAAGRHVGQLTVNASNGQSHAIALSVDSAGDDSGGSGGGDPPPPSAPVLAISADAFDYGFELSSAGLTIRNAGTGAMTYQLVPADDWLVPSPAGGTSSGETDTIALDVDRAKLADGAHHTTVTVVTEHGESRDISIVLRHDADPSDLDSFPYFIQWLTSEEQALITDLNRDVLVRPFVGYLYAPPNHFDAFKTWYLSQRPDGIIGRYFTGYCATPPEDANTLPRHPEPPSDDYLLRRSDGSFVELYYASNGQWRRIWDHTKPYVRQYNIDFWLANSQKADFLFIDNIIYKFSNFCADCEPGADAWWQGLRDLFSELRDQSDKPFIINTATSLAETWPELIPYVDGFHSEMALNALYHINPARREYWIGGELAAFRQALDAGKTVILTNNNAWAYIDDDAAFCAPDVCGPFFAAVVALVRNPGEPMYFHTNGNGNNDFNPREYHEWWRRLGSPRAPYTYSNMTFRREFEYGFIELDISTDRPRVRIEVEDDPLKELPASFPG